MRATSCGLVRCIFVLAACAAACTPMFAAKNQAPEWMHALTSVPLPAHDEKTSVVELYYDENLTVLTADKFRSTVRAAFKILRPEGRDAGDVIVVYKSLLEKVTSIHAWCIPADGKDYEVTDKDAVDVSPLKGAYGELVTDVRAKALQIPAADPGNIVGYEYVKEWHPLVLQDTWNFQGTFPVRESHYSLALPAGWEFKDEWANYPHVQSHDGGGGLWQWSVGDVKEIRMEEDMPPLAGVEGRMVLTLFQPGGTAQKAAPTWQQVGAWENTLTNGRLDASPEIKQQVAELTANAPTPLAKMRALAEFMQRNIRYVAIELGIGGFQPHPAAQIFAHRYGDCKDKATLLRSMLAEIGVESYFVDINTTRGSVTRDTPASEFSFNHVITAIRLPDGLTDSSLIATIKHPTLGTLLFFDPTNEDTPFGEIGGHLQANYGLLVTPAGGELVELPQQPSTMNSIRRTGKLTLTASGLLQGDIEEIRVGDRARAQREMFKSAQKSTDQIKPVEVLLSDSLSAYRLTKATVGNLQDVSQPFIWDYSFQAANYAKSAGNLLLVRPRVLGSKSDGVLETSEPRRFPIELPAPALDIDNFEIALPPGYVVDDLPPAIDVDFPFASYHSKSEVKGNVLHYLRTFEVKELSVPVSEAPQLKKFYRIIASDERNNAVLKQAQ